MRPAAFYPASCNRKLSPTSIDRSQSGRGRDLRALPPYVCSTRVSIEATCPDSCAFKRGGCYERAGFTGRFTREMDTAAARGWTPDMVTALESSLIEHSFGAGPVPQDGARGGRDLRLHVGGDVSSTRGARMLARAAENWRARGGGSVWTYTARWRQVPRAAWGDAIRVLASCQSEADARSALDRGYAPALTARSLPSDGRAFALGDIRVVPCPAETRGVTCVSCRLCLDRDLASMRVGVAFEMHGKQAAQVRRRLPVFAEVAAHG